MKMDLKVQLKLGHQLVMTPQLQQAIKLLQLSRYELEQLINQSLVENPVLEASDSPLESAMTQEDTPTADSDSTNIQEENSSSEEEPDFEPEPAASSEIASEWQEYTMAGGGLIKEYGSANDEDNENNPFENYTAAQQSLSSHLEWQIEVSTLTEVEKNLAYTLIGHLDDLGFLSTSLQEIWQKDPDFAKDLKLYAKQKKAEIKNLAPFQPQTWVLKHAQENDDKQTKAAGSPSLQQLAEQNFSQAEQDYARLLEALLKQLQILDPIGVFCRSVQECLLIQAKLLLQPDSLAIKILAKHFHHFLKQDFLKIVKLESCTLDDVLAAKNQISTLEPNPARNYNNEPLQYILPDVYVFKIGSEYKVRLNQENLPQLSISNYYQKLSDEMQKEYGKKKNKSDDANVLAWQYLSEKIRSGEWLIKSIEQRQKNIKNVAESIVKRQSEFLERGIEALKPMVLKDVAEDIGVHESTVSRITNQKYIHTPQGIFELKFFFTSGIQQEDGEFISSQKIKDLIQKLIQEENPKKPLTDSQIAIDLEKNMGITVARRTVAKYREALHLAPSNRRKIRY